MKILTYCCIIILCSLQAAQAQNIVVMKNGDKLKGKVEMLKDDILTFAFQGNKMKIKVSEVGNIYFDTSLAVEKQQPAPVAKATAPGKIYGVITYFFNSNYGDKPDVGAKIYIVDSSKAPELSLGPIDSVNIGCMMKYYYDFEMRKNRFAKSKTIEDAERYNALDTTLFNQMKDRASHNFYSMQVPKWSKILTVDATGAYSANLQPGTYYVVVQSNNRKGECSILFNGKIFTRKIVVKAEDEINISTNFTTY